MPKFSPKSAELNPINESMRYRIVSCFCFNQLFKFAYHMMKCALNYYLSTLINFFLQIGGVVLAVNMRSAQSYLGRIFCGLVLPAETTYGVNARIWHTTNKPRSMKRMSSSFQIKQVRFQKRILCQNWAPLKARLSLRLVLRSQYLVYLAGLLWTRQSVHMVPNLLAWTTMFFSTTLTGATFRNLATTRSTRPVFTRIPH